jgi:Ca2+-binding RTX toxin-like protein
MSGRGEPRLGRGWQHGLAVAALTATVALGLPASAGALTVSLPGQHQQLTGIEDLDAAEPNDLTVVYDNPVGGPGPHILVTEERGRAPLTAGDGCEQAGSTTVRCFVQRTIRQVRFDTGGAADTLVIDGSMAFAPIEFSRRGVIDAQLGRGADSFVGSPMSDRVHESNGDDEIRGAGDNDILNGGPGADNVFGGAGNDVIKANDGEAERRINCGKDHDRVTKDAGKDPRVRNCEVVRRR